jgi:hypothetical protein
MIISTTEPAIVGQITWEPPLIAQLVLNEERMSGVGLSEDIPDWEAYHDQVVKNLEQHLRGFTKLLTAVILCREKRAEAHNIVERCLTQMSADLERIAPKK